MNSEDRFWSIFNLCLTAIFVTIVLSIYNYNVKCMEADKVETAAFLKAGFVKEVHPGSTFNYWVKR